MLARGEGGDEGPRTLRKFRNRCLSTSLTRAPYFVSISSRTNLLNPVRIQIYFRFVFPIARRPGPDPSCVDTHPSDKSDPRLRPN